MDLSLRERFGRLGPIQAINRVSIGSPAVLSLRPMRGSSPLRTVDGTLALARRGLTLLRAKRTIEALVIAGRVQVSLPTVEDMDALTAELAGAGIAATLVSQVAGSHVRLLRERLGLTPEDFAARFGVDLDTLERWESGAAEPDATARSYLRAIAGNPDAVADAYAMALS